MLIIASSSQDNPSWAGVVGLGVVEVLAFAVLVVTLRRAWRGRDQWRQLRRYPRATRNRVARRLQRRQQIDDQDLPLAETIAGFYRDLTRVVVPLLLVSAAFMLTLAWTIGSFMRWTFVAVALAQVAALPGFLWLRRVIRLTPSTGLSP
jgi:hypothetical protein